MENIVARFLKKKITLIFKMVASAGKVFLFLTSLPIFVVICFLKDRDDRPLRVILNWFSLMDNNVEYIFPWHFIF